MNKLRAIIVDDELHGRENLKNLLDTYCPEINVVGLAESAVQAKILVNEKDPDVVFLDINMPVLNGFDFLESLDKRNFMLVFVSAYEHYGIKALKAHPVDYLLKPINIKELQQTVKELVIKKREISRLPGEKIPKIMVPVSHGFTILECDQIVRFMADNCYTKIFTAEGKVITVSRTLKEFESIVPDISFFRIHKSHLVNLQYVKEFSNLDGGFVIMKDSSKLELSRRKIHEFIQKIKHFSSAGIKSGK
jgi:two-component system, LytTR family, response regulator